MVHTSTPSPAPALAPAAAAITSTADSGGASEQEVALRRLTHLQQLYRIYKVESWGLYEELRAKRQRLDGSTGKHTRRSARVSSVRESFRQRSQIAAQPNAAGPATADRQPAAASRDSSGAASADQLPAAAAAQAATSGAAAQPRAGEPRHSGAAATGAAARADAGSRAANGERPSAQATEGIAAAHSQPRADGTGGDEHQAGLVPYSSSEGGEDSEETLTDAIVIDDKIVSRAATNTAQDVGDDVRGYGSDDDVPTYSDVEEHMLRTAAAGSAQDASATVQWRREVRTRLADIGRLEEAATAATGRDLTREGAIAVLVGRKTRFLIKRPSIVIGRSHADSERPDVDVSLEGHAGKVSRQQAKLELKRDGCFYVRNYGARPMYVNSTKLDKGQCVAVQNLSLLELGGGIRFLLMINMEAVRRVLRATARMAL